MVCLCCVDMVSVRSRSPKRPSRSRHVSVVSENILDDTNLSSVTVIAVRHDANDMTPDQLCDLGEWHPDGAPIQHSQR